jgi:hypothetical protein
VTGRAASWDAAVLILPTAGAVVLLGVTLAWRPWMEGFFVHGTYYVLLGLLGAWVGVHLAALRGVDRGAVARWGRDNAAGLATAVLVGLVAVLAVAPAFRILADETNLVGVSKNLFAKKAANFATTGKYYYENFHALSETIDRRPALYPFLVSLVHALRGYDPTHAFHVNAVLIPLFALVAYRLAKSLGGELYGVAAGLLVMAHPITLMSARSAGFDVLAAFLALVIIKGVHDHARAPSATRLAMVWANLCLLAHVRYEGLGLLVVGSGLLAALRLATWELVRPYRVLYGLTPLFLLPRIWQTILKADDIEQPLGIALFGLDHAARNVASYLGLLGRPFDFGQPHAPLVIALGLVGGAGVAAGLPAALRSAERPWPLPRFAVFVAAWVAVMAAVSFAYRWGRPLHPASARLFVWLDTLLSFTAAWALVELCRRPAPWLAPLGAAGLLLASVPAASEGRFLNQLTLTRQAAGVWRYLERLGTKRIMVVTDRPGLYTVMDYGAVDLAAARQGEELLVELSRHLYEAVYVIQEVDLATGRPRPGFEIWPDREKEVVLEFQNAEDWSVRVSRVAHGAPRGPTGLSSTPALAPRPPGGPSPEPGRP